MVVRPVGPAVGLPIEPALADPAWPQFPGRSWAPWEFRAGPIGAVEQHVHEVGVGGIVVVQRHEHVARVATYHDVLRLREEAQPVCREMALDETTVALSLNGFEHRFDRSVEPGVYPRGDLHQPGREWGTPEHESGGDALYPGRSSLVRSRDEDVVVTRYVPIPPRAIEVMIAVLASSLWRSCWFTHCPLLSMTEPPN